MPDPRFHTTHWSVVFAAGERRTPDADDALSTLCAAYWYPLYAFVRRSGYDAEAASDLTQGFFARVIEKNFLREADPQRGRFRSFLLASLKHFLSNERERERALKRGGGATLLSIEPEEGESRYAREPVDARTPDVLFERGWAVALLEHVLERLRGELDAEGKAHLFDALKPMLMGERADHTYREIGEGLGMSEGAVKVAVHRLRRRYRDVLEEEIGRTLADPTQLEDEIRHLFAALAR